MSKKTLDQQIDQQRDDAQRSQQAILRASDAGYLPKSKDEWQLLVICELTQAVLLLTKVLRGGADARE